MKFMENFELAKNLFIDGLSCLENDNFEVAEIKFRQSLELVPDRLSTLINLSATLIKLRKYDIAKEVCLKAISLDQNSPESWLNLGSIELYNQKFQRAIDCFNQAIQLKPSYVEAWSNKGAVLRSLKRYSEALTSIEEALSIKPDDSEAWFNKGGTLNDLNRYDEALVSFNRALTIQPEYAEAHSGRGVTLFNLKRCDEAFSAYEKALNLKPDYATAHFNLGNALLISGKLDKALASYRQTLALEPEHVEARSLLLYALNYIDHTPKYYLKEARIYGRLVRQRVGTRFSDWLCSVKPKQLKVGIVSGDLRNHSVGHFLEGMLARINPDRIELIAYPTFHKEDDLTSRIRPYFSAWKPLFDKIDEDAARLIRSDGVHVLIDLSGHTAHNRLPLFAWKPSPVQVTWLGYFATTGVAELDYFLADEVSVPVSHQVHFTESVWYLPETRLCFTPPTISQPISPLPSLRNGFVTFGCFQNLAKVSDDVLDVWAQILSALPDARLRIQAKQLDKESHVKELLGRLQHHGIEQERVSIHASTHREAYLASHAEVDIILDTFPFTGGTTTCEALWMGVPTLTLAGNSLLARQGASLNTAAGLTQWVVESRKDYVSRAIALATDRSGLAGLRAALRQQVQVSPLFDSQRFARNFEDALWGMWEARNNTQLQC